MCFCSDEFGPLGEHGCHVIVLGALGSDTSAGNRWGLCRWPGECGHVLGLRAAVATVYAACFLPCVLVGGCWILGGVFWLLPAGVHCGSRLAAALEVLQPHVSIWTSRQVSARGSLYTPHRQRRRETHGETTRTRGGASRHVLHCWYAHC